MIKDSDQSRRTSAAVHLLPALGDDIGEARAAIDFPAVSNGQAQHDAKPTIILMVDPHSLTRESIAHWLGSHAEEFRILPLASPADAIADVANDVGLIMLNIGAAQVTDIAVRQRLDLLKQRFPSIPVVLVADRDESCCITEALRQGVRGYIPTSLSLSVVIEALRLVRAGGTFIPAAAFMGGLEGRPAAMGPESNSTEAEIDGLTPRQTEVLELLRQGKPNKVIAYELQMQQSTVKVHVRHIMMKLKATNRTQAVFLADQLLKTKHKADSPDA
jgi:DNA-binding NarL/FixJ family response regulator